MWRDPEECNSPVPCSGGQFCWEDECVVFPYEDDEDEVSEKDWQIYTGARFVGTYDGYGRVTSELHPKKRFYPIQFSEYFDGWFGREKDKSKLMIVGSICCKSCYDEHNNEKSNKRKGKPKGAAKSKERKAQ